MRERQAGERGPGHRAGGHRKAHGKSHSVPSTHHKLPLDLTCHAPRPTVAASATQWSGIWNWKWSYRLPSTHDTSTTEETGAPKPSDKGTQGTAALPPKCQSTLLCGAGSAPGKSSPGNCQLLLCPIQGPQARRLLPHAAAPHWPGTGPGSPGRSPGKALEAQEHACAL